jgi:hypothetical protein
MVEALYYKLEGHRFKHDEASTFFRQLTDGSEVVSLMCRLPVTSRKIPGAWFY